MNSEKSPLEIYLDKLRDLMSRLVWHISKSDYSATAHWAIREDLKKHASEQWDGDPHYRTRFPEEIQQEAMMRVAFAFRYTNNDKSPE